MICNLTGKKFHCHAKPLFANLGLVKVTDLIKTNQIILVKKIKKDFLPPTIETLLKYKSDADKRLTICHLDQSGTQLPGRYNICLCPTIEACRSWNNCPIGIKNLPKLKQIKQSLSEFYISKYETLCTTPNCYPCTQN